jgi:hypothetical protein
MVAGVRLYARLHSDRLLAVEGLVWAAFSAMLFPAGYWVGARLRDAVLASRMRKPFFYTTFAAIVICCWVASAFAIAAGL